MYEPQPIERRKLYEVLAEELLAQIGARRLGPGDVLPPERELTQRYRVGRSSVREALRMLESRGLIAAAGNGSFRVAEYRSPLNASLTLLMRLSEATMGELYELRRALECEAAALAATRRQPDHLDRLAHELGEMSESLDDADRYIESDLRFHLAIAEASGNRLLLHSMHAVRDQIRRALQSIFLIPTSAARSLEHHGEIHAAIEAADAEAARARMREHLVRVEADVHRVATEGLAAVVEPGEAGR